MAECVARIALGYEVHIFEDALAATVALDDGLPDLILLDILLKGPNGFTFLNELGSYADTAKIPIIIISSLSLKNLDRKSYNIKTVLNKETMLPEQLAQEIKNAL